MRMTLAILTVLALASLSACSKGPYDPYAPGTGKWVHSTQYHEHAVYNLYLGRTYMYEGRYELAREHLLIALPSARTEEMRSVIMHELEAVDMIIKSQR